MRLDQPRRGRDVPGQRPRQVGHRAAQPGPPSSGRRGPAPAPGACRLAAADSAGAAAGRGRPAARARRRTVATARGRRPGSSTPTAGPSGRPASSRAPPELGGASRCWTPSSRSASARATSGSRRWPCSSGQSSRAPVVVRRRPRRRWRSGSPYTPTLRPQVRRVQDRSGQPVGHHPPRPAEHRPQPPQEASGRGARRAPRSRCPADRYAATISGSAASAAYRQAVAGPSSSRQLPGQRRRGRRAAAGSGCRAPA